MKVDAPEKIHIQPNAYDRWFEGKIPSGLPNGLFVEYTRDDAFIEKACEWLKFNYAEFTDNTRLGIKIDELIKDFKQAMEE